ncbi:hypothetical protein LJC20_00405 [Eubacteriales bacterium OttesenSCG-928-M02]|nr:hypothetical protein [Eubacteriales bacterium OttesenSCG-928-M02]
MNKDYLRREVENGTAIYCETIEEAEQLFEVMGWDACWHEGMMPYGWPSDYVQAVYYAVQEGEWNGHDGDAGLISIMEMKKINAIKRFSDIANDNRSNLARVLGVEEGQEFGFEKNGCTYCIDNGRRKVRYSNEGTFEECHGEDGLSDMIKNPDKIRISEPVTYSEESIALARAAEKMGYARAMRFEKEVTLYSPSGSSRSYVNIPDECFPEISVGENVRLEDIR